MSAVATPRSAVEGALVGWLLERPASSMRLPVGALTKAEKAAELQRLQARKAMDAAYEAELILGLADDTPDTCDPAPDHPGARRGSWAPDAVLPGVSEFFPAELAVLLNCGRGAATAKAHRAWAYRENLPATWAAMARGALDESRAGVLADVLASTTPATARRIEALLLPEASSLSRRRLRARALELLVELDAEAVDARRADARRHADVRSYPSHLEGMATLAADLPADEAAEARDVIDQLARMAKVDGDERPIGQIRAEIFSLLVRRPAGHGLPTTTAHVTVTATLDALEGNAVTAGSVDGLPITAAHLRELLHRLDALGLRTPPGGSLTLALTDADGRLLATLTPVQLRGLVARGCPTHPGAAAGCTCPLLGRPEATGAYTPTAAQDRFLTTRDRGCRMPNCDRPAGWTDRDHVISHADGGPTDCTNLCCLCRSHHRLKTLAPGWQFHMTPDGVLHVTTPSGVTRTTRPPGMRPPQAGPPATGSNAPTPGGGSPRTADPDDDPPPF